MVKNFKEEFSSKNMKERGTRLKCISNTRRKEVRSEEMIWNKAGESILSLGILSPRTPAGRYWSSRLGLVCTLRTDGVGKKPFTWS